MVEVPRGGTGTRMKRSAMLLALLASLPALADAGWQDWRELELRARAAMFLSGSVELRWVDQPGERWLVTETRARFLGATIARSSTRTRLSAEDGRVLEYIDQQSDRARRYTFDERGYTVEKLQPGPDPDAPLAAWEVTFTAHYDAPLDASGTPVVVHDYYSTLMQLAELGLVTSGDSTTVWVASTDGPQPYRIELGEARTERRRLRLDDDRRRQRVDLAELRLRVVAADPDNASSKFMGMQGEIEMWVEAESKTLVEIIGKVPKVPGKVSLETARLR